MIYNKYYRSYCLSYLWYKRAKWQDDIYNVFYIDLTEQVKIYEDNKITSFDFDKYLEKMAKFIYTFKLDSNDNYNLWK